jgi:D-alanyl-D-alanine carboxypeptidase
MATDLLDPIPISSLTGLNSGLHSCPSSTMITLMGAPLEPLVQNECRNDNAAPAVKALLATRQITPRFKLRGIKPALDSVEAVLAKVNAARSDLIEQLGTEGMLCVRHKKPTNGAPSDDPSNHSWGTAVDFKFGDGEAPGNTHGKVPRWVAILVPFFNEAGWFSGISFNDTMHFEVANETIHKWAHDGLLGTPPVGPVVAGSTAGTGSGGSGGGGSNAGSSGSEASGFAAVGDFFSRLFGRG